MGCARICVSWWYLEEEKKASKTRSAVGGGSVDVAAVVRGEWVEEASEAGPRTSL
jgi:hypothetical protein